MSPGESSSDVLDIGWSPFGQAIVHAYRKYGMDSVRALKHANIAPGRMPSNKARIPMEQYLSLAGFAMRELNDEALGWFSRRLPWGVHSLLIRGSLSAPDLGVALKRRIRHHNLFVDDVKLVLVVDGQIASLRIHEVDKTWEHESLRRVCPFLLLAGILGSGCWMVDSRIPVLKMSLPFAPPSQDDDYSALLGCPVLFNQTEASIGFDSRYLDLPLLRDEGDIGTVLRHPLELTMYRYRRDRMLVHRIRDLLAKRGDIKMTAERVADALNVSLRTLHRRLREEGTTLQCIKDDIRHTKAIHLLSSTAQPIKQISAAVGFGNEKNFSRAFRQWSGESPAMFRRWRHGLGGQGR